ncbi:alpha-amylase family glycosyl hydrolase [Leptolyngbya sp. CCNP1308]|uniref:alpha-amylase family glycosyl hydrolase n=1 Tax=Leptolyngbya sp. CCNP1308 TaxID=3110255 RepID=UPI002B1FAE9E|nr:alpha-amylase family glycosyl hydrolase [Leptolyngbya sp. CCNP1308]MEA5451718.1 alpha-amylase family glycosyl hydrolase [Leptolyngbya sp. CCNP1308]
MANSIEFELFAPYSEGAVLIGSFTDWKDVSMEKGKDGYFRVSVDLDDGDYNYKFRVQSKSFFLEVNEWIDVIDPKAKHVDEGHQFGIVQIKGGEPIVDSYVWHHDEKGLPQNDELIIYEILVSDFSGGEDDSYPRGKFEHIIEKLDYLCELGINAIELMPIQEFPGEHGWGYNTHHYFSPESTYGKSKDFKHLVDECHSRGIRIILDIILNHSGSEAPLTKIDYSYWYRREPKDPEQNWGPEFDYDHYDEHLDLYPAQEFVKDILRFWISEYHIDGFRFDAVSQMGHFDFIGQLTQETTQLAQPKPFYNIGELIPESPDATNLEGPLDACWRDGFLHQIRPLLLENEGDIETIKELVDAKRSGYLGAVNAINYLSNHDHDRLMVQLANHEIFDEAAFKRAKLGAVLVMTAMGVPLIWMGEEFGAYNPKTLEPAKIDWSLLDNDRNYDLMKYYRGLIHLRKNNRALRTEDVEFFYEDAEAKVLAYIRWTDEGSRVVVVVNFSGQYLADYNVRNFPHNGTWHEWTNDYDVEVNDGVWTTDLPEYEAKVLVV